MKSNQTKQFPVLDQKLFNMISFVVNIAFLVNNEMMRMLFTNIFYLPSLRDMQIWSEQPLFNTNCNFAMKLRKHETHKNVCFSQYNVFFYQFYSI